MLWQLVAMLAAAIFSAAATIWDLRTRRIPDALNYFGILCGFLLALLSGINAFAMIAFCTVAFAFALGLFKMGAWAGGDAKFFTALSALLTPLAGLHFQSAIDWLAPFLAFVLAGFALAVCKVVRKSPGKLRLKMRDVRQGDVPVWFSRARGLSAVEISSLKAAGVSAVTVRTMWPFAPFLALGFGFVAAFALM